MYEWLSGDRPFHGSLTELVGQHLSVTPPSLQEKVSMISPEVDLVVLTALSKDPKQRFASVQVFSTALEQASQLPQSKIGVPPPRQSSSPTNTIEAILPDPSSLPTNTIIPLSPWLQTRNVVTPPAQSLQPTDVVIPSTSLSQPTVAATPTRTPAVSPPSTEEPIPPGGPLPSRHHISRRVIVMGLAGLAITGGGITWLALSQRLQKPSSSFRPTAIPTPTNTPTPTPTPLPIGTTLLTYHGHSDWVSDLAWSPDGKYIASGGFDKTVQVWQAS